MEIFNGYMTVKGSSQGRDFPQFSKAKATVLKTGEEITILYPIQPRGQIQEFSKKSRLRFLKSVHSLSIPPDTFLTLTYPGSFSPDSREWKIDLHTFSKRLSRAFPKSWFYWKLEPQKRGAPHYHLIGNLGLGLLSEVDMIRFRKWLARSWYLVVGSDDPKHLQAGTQADIIDDSRPQLKRYISKYVGKVVEESKNNIPGWALPGRFWGVIGRKNLPPVENYIVSLTQDQSIQLKRTIRRWMKKINAKYSHFMKRLDSFFVFLDKDQVIKLLDYVLDHVPAVSRRYGKDVLSYEWQHITLFEGANYGY